MFSQYISDDEQHNCNLTVAINIFPAATSQHCSHRLAVSLDVCHKVTTLHALKVP